MFRTSAVALAVLVTATVMSTASLQVAGAAVLGAKPVPYPSTVKTTLGVPYSSASPLNELDVVQPISGSQNGMGIILVHGGGYNSGGKSEMDQAAASFAAAGWVAFNMNYSLNEYPNETNDVFAAIAWVRQHAATYGINPDHLAMLGSSAGGTLVGIVATEGAANGDPVSAVATWSGPMDLTSLVNDSAPGSYAYQHPIIYAGGCTPAQCPATYTAASPVNHVSSTTTPFLLANSTNEVIPLSQAQEMDNALIAAHVPQELDVIPGTGHSTAYENVEIAPTIAFLTKYTQANPQPAAAGTTTTSPTTTTTTPHGVASPTTTPSSRSQPASHVRRDFLLGVLVVLVVVLIAIFLYYRSGRRRHARSR